MDYIITFDNREKELIKILEEKGYSVNLENLDIGDIQFTDLKTKEIIIVIERKTLADLSASIKDGRYKEQKERLLHSIKKSCRKIILIEGDDYNTFSLPLNTLNSVIINTLLRDNMHIYISKSKEDTILFIENIMAQLPKYYNDLQKEIILGEEKTFQNEFNCQTSKKENITLSICFRNMLCQIPGISNTIANIFVEKHNNIEDFINYFRKNYNDKNTIINIISNEKYGKNNRKIGNKIAEKIFNHIFTDETNIQTIPVETIPVQAIPVQTNTLSIKNKVVKPKKNKELDLNIPLFS